MVQAIFRGSLEGYERVMDQEAIEKPTDGSDSNRRSDGCCMLWIVEQ
jgi:hypothetical protein